MSCNERLLWVGETGVKSESEPVKRVRLWVREREGVDAANAVLCLRERERERERKKHNKRRETEREGEERWVVGMLLVQ
ncbi:hypothetical protein EJ06DRAFT_434316 [Trichodelitschia bisporula]|uniref:Uncharacterized protein n=1 Tax=Trichodelitschia bisporula TaxID=703511 RepID=A0A6G1HX15_9PEZI|nr:hypothetical protein EJ06DRAFT_434316 [Trichodelitschia bisporula]